MNPYETDSWIRISEEIRSTISEIFDASPSHRIILAPGVLLSLRLLFDHIGLKCLLRFDEDYFTQDAFPQVECHRDLAYPDVIDEKCKDPNSLELGVIENIVSWKTGVRTPPSIDGKGSSTYPYNNILRIVDYSHGGACGFPPVSELNADIVVGDLCKWIVPPGKHMNLAFIWVKSETLFQIIKAAFEPFFLAVSGTERSRQSRWIHSDDLLELKALIDAGRLQRRFLSNQHKLNLDLAMSLSGELGRQPTGTSVLWFPLGATSPILEKLREQGLVWTLPEGQRVMCRNY